MIVDFRRSSASPMGLLLRPREKFLRVNMEGDLIQAQPWNSSAPSPLSVKAEKANLHPAILTTFYLRTAEHILCSYVSVSCGNCNKTEPKSLQYFVMTAEKIMSLNSRCVCIIDLHSFCMHLAICTLPSKYSSMLKRYIQIHRNNFPGFPSLDDWACTQYPCDPTPLGNH